MRTILIDMDNVVADQIGGFLRRVKKQYPSSALPKRSDLRHFDFEYNLEPEMRERVRAVRLEKGFFADLVPVRGALAGMVRLSHSYDVRIVTAPTWEWQHCVEEKYAWVQEHLGRAWCGRMVLTRDKTLVRGDILLDDAPDVRGVMTPVWTHVLFDQPYNRSAHGMRATWSNIESVLEHVGVLGAAPQRINSPYDIR